MSQHHAATSVKRYRAKVANQGFRGQYWQQGDIVEVSAEEAEIIPHHFEELGQGDDGSESPEMREKLQEQEKIDHLKDRKAQATYDRVQPVIVGGPAVAIDKKPEDRTKEAVDRKAEEKENDARKEELRKNPRKRGAVIAPEDAAVIARVAEQHRDEAHESSKHKK